MKSNNEIDHVTHDDVIHQIGMLQSMLPSKASWSVSCTKLAGTQIVKLEIERVIQNEDYDTLSDTMWSATISNKDLDILKLRIKNSETLQYVRVN